MKYILVVFLSFILFVSAVNAQQYSIQTPTIMPTSPVYKLQLAWDKISLLFTYGPSSKMTRYLQLADRELAIAEKLMQSGSYTDLALRSAFRGENYITLFVLEMKGVVYSGGSIDKPLIANAHSAGAYHQQLIDKLIQSSSGDTQNSLKTILEFSQRNDNQLSSLESEYSAPTLPQ